MDAISKKLLKLAVDPNATMEDLISGIDLLTAAIDADNRRIRCNQAAQHRATVNAASGDPAALRRLANANLAKRYK